MAHRIIQAGDSRSFPAAHAFLIGAIANGDIHVYIGARVGEAFTRSTNRDQCTAHLVELGDECLGVHTGEARGNEGSNVLGFARFRMGSAEPSNLIELVKQPQTSPAALVACKALFELFGFKVAVCSDVPGRIVNRLIRPYLNAALRRLDERLASAGDLDATLKMGLGYPEGPIALLERTGLAAHFDVTQALYEWTGDAAFAPARRARVAKLRGAAQG
ncbi:MAG: 3-hydroxyacyl-CoA dehydrogenase [Betaproteobacteria bacterium]|nr:3-hydroxyacyl-CoA dehydrogenase [Betaproteobacteria bacterium]